MKKNTLANFIGEFPARALEWPLFLVQLGVGLFIVSPFFSPDNAPNGNLATAGSESALKVYGAVLVVLGIIGVVGLIKNKVNWRRLAAFVSFFLFTYFTLLRILLMGPENMGWTSYFLNALMCGAIYLRLKWEAR